jgi:hypothetical protein
MEPLERRALLSGGPTSYTVNSTSGGNSGAGTSGTLAYVISQANANPNPAGSVIQFDSTVFDPPSTYSILLGATLNLAETGGPEVIVGPAGGVLTVSGNGASQVFNVAAGATASISGLSIAGGTSSGLGGGIFNAGSLGLTDCTLANNSPATSSHITIIAAAASKLNISAPATVTAGVPFSITVTALDPFNNVATSYRGTVRFGSSDPRASLPKAYTFTSADNGVHVFTNGVTLRTPGMQTVKAWDTVNLTINGAGMVNVTGTSSAVRRFTVTARDQKVAHARLALGARPTPHASRLAHRVTERWLG